MSNEIERTNTLLNTDDAMVWAEEFCRIFDGFIIGQFDLADPTTKGVDPGTMVGWFANAMQTAVNQYERMRDSELREARKTAATEHVREQEIAAFDEGVADGREDVTPA